MHWRLIAGTVAFTLWAPPSLLGLPLAALLAVSGDRSARTLALTAALGAASLGLLGGASGGRLAAATSAYIVLVAAAFVSAVLLRPAPLLRQAFRAMLAAGAATALLVHAAWGADAWGALAWEATRQAGLAMRFLVERTPEAFAVYEPVVRFLSLLTPGMLALQTLAGLALAWHWHLRLSTAPPLGAAPTPFREFRLSDGWVWGIVVWLAVLIAPVSGVLHVAGANLGFVLGALYVLRGAAIAAVVAETFGVSATVVAIAAGAAAALFVPLLFLLPGLYTLGITDTWYHYRRRLAARRPHVT